MSGPRVPDGPGRLDNGLQATTYVPLTDVDAEVGRHLLVALGRARIAAYLLATSEDADSDQRRLFVASDERGDARTIVVATVRAMGSDQPEPIADQDQPAGPADPLAGIDTDAEFQRLVADWHVDTHEAIREAERDLRREDADWRARLVTPPVEEPVWLDDDHYVPPAPPPLPRLALQTVLAIALLALGVVILGFGTGMGFDPQFTFILGIGSLLGAGAILFTRIRDFRRDDDEDDGSAV